jgi:SNF2 family DNA or RNA helicase
VFSARNNFTEAIIKELANRDISVAHYKGSNMEAAEAQFQSGEAKVFLSNLQPSAYGLNSLAKCKYAIYVCLDYKAEVYYQSKHRLLRGQLTEPKFAYNLYMANTMERRIIDSMQLGLDLINDISDKEIFMPVKE